jgi:FkbM family methyltransferase
MLKWLEHGDYLLIEVDGHPMYIFNEPHFLSFYLDETYEPYTTRLFKNALTVGGTVLDVGANIGCFALIAGRRVGPQGKVYAFEPGPENFGLLERNIRLNGLENIIAIRKAVGNGSKTIQFRLAERSDHHSIFVPPMVATKEVISVESTTIDETLQGKPVDVIKMDIEGNELSALEGMQETIRRSEALTLFVELNPVCLRQAGVRPGDLVERLTVLGFRLFAIAEEDRRLTPVAATSVREFENHPEGWFVNLYCVNHRR